MDDPNLDPARHRHALRGLARLNRLSRSSAFVWNAIADLLTPTQNADAEPLTLLDIAAGAGDVPIDLLRAARDVGRGLRVTACDISATALDHAQHTARDAGVTLNVFRHDAVADPIPDTYDVVTCSLFLHHLEHDDALRLMRHMRDAARRRVVINDISRTRLNLALIWIGTRLVTRSDIVHTDAMRSVRAALTVDEARRLAAEAGLADARIVPRFPCRYVITWNRT